MAILADATGLVAAGWSEDHAPMGARVAACLDAASGLIDLKLLDDVDLVRLSKLRRAEEMYDAFRALERGIAAVGDRIDDRSSGARGIKVRRMKDLRSDMQSLALELQRGFLERQQSMLIGIGDALTRLAGAESTSQLIERSAQEVCRSCGAERCCVFRTDGSKLFAESVHFAGDPAFQEEWEAFARANPPELAAQDPEVQSLRRRVPILVVNDPPDGGGMHAVLEAGRAHSYVAAPIVVRGSVIGMIHADRYYSGLTADPVIRDSVATFASGLGQALERTALIDRTRSQLHHMRALMAEVEASMEDIFYSGVSLRRSERGVPGDGRHMPAVPIPAESRMGTLLTRRELEVIELMARGASNGDIANRLVISEGTVKSHVKHILRKLRAANRAQAVSTYVRIQSASRPV